jgi:hypothetical protein
MSTPMRGTFPAGCASARIDAMSRPRARVMTSLIRWRVMRASCVHRHLEVFYAPYAREENQILQVKSSKSMDIIRGHTTAPEPMVSFTRSCFKGKVLCVQAGNIPTLVRVAEGGMGGMAGEPLGLWRGLDGLDVTHRRSEQARARGSPADARYTPASLLRSGCGVAQSSAPSGPGLLVGGLAARYRSCG